MQSSKQTNVEIVRRCIGRGRGALHPPGPAPKPQASIRPNTIRVRKRQNTGPPIVPGDLLSAVKNQGLDFLCLQRQPTGDYLLTLAHPEQKQKLLFQGTIDHKNVAYWFDDPDKKVTFVNIFGAPFELSDVVLQAQLRKYGTLLAARHGKYQSHPEVENGTYHVRMILRKNIPTTLYAGPLQISMKYEGQPHTCNKCGEQGHSAVTWHHIRCFGCGHCWTQYDRPNICLFCGSVTHTSNA